MSGPCMLWDKIHGGVLFTGKQPLVGPVCRLVTKQLPAAKHEAYAQACGTIQPFLFKNQPPFGLPSSQSWKWTIACPNQSSHTLPQSASVGFTFSELATCLPPKWVCLFAFGTLLLLWYLEIKGKPPLFFFGGAKRTHPNKPWQV